MFVQEVILDGFKSYATRTVISFWDPEFNAITGLNGSGKSNVLDAICFVLGLTNLSQVRASNLQDLVYKRGQAGITKASVTIVFNNADKKQSPIGFEQVDTITVSRQVVIGGKNKFLINGHVAQNQTVANLFQSVQLNINNPHFLIMQGRITKVLNMKPPEILAMIEEAAGTRMFEEKKEKALKTIAKKDLKLTEITDLMENDITPKLDKLKKEKADFMAFQKIEGELERLKRFVTAHDYSMAAIRVEKSKHNLTEKEDRLRLLNDENKVLKKEIEYLKLRLSELSKKKEKEMKKSTKFRDLQEKVNSLLNQLTRMNAQHDLKEKAIEEEQANLDSLESQKNELIRVLDGVNNTYAAFEKEVAMEKANVKEMVESVQKQESFLQTLSTGISANEGQENGFSEQIQVSKEEKAAANTELEKGKLRIKFLKDQINQKELDLREAQAENKESMKKQEKLKKNVETYKIKVSKMRKVDGDDTQLRVAAEKLKKIISDLEDKIDCTSGQLSNLDFSYSDPYQGFDKSKVKGLVAKLIKLDTSNIDFSTALQVCAEGRLYFVVVEDNKVASDLLKSGKLKRKYTIIPLKQIVTSSASAEKIERAKKLAPGKVEHALRLIGYEDEVLPAMKFVFGNTFICKDGETAKRIAYDPAIKMRCITVDGDVYDPGATITGGSAPSSNDILKKLSLLSEMETQLEKLKVEYENLSQSLEKINLATRELSNVENDLRSMEFELESIEKVMAASSFGMVIAEVEKMKKEITELEEKSKTFLLKMKDCEEHIKYLEKEVKEFSTNKVSKLKKLEADVVKSKKELAKQQLLLKEKNQKFIQLKSELESAQKDLKDCDSSIISTHVALESLKKELDTIQNDIERTKIKYDEDSSELDELSAVFATFDAELNECEIKKSRQQSKLEENQLEIQKLTHELDNLEKEFKNDEKTLIKLSQEHEWIDEQKDNFGKPFTSFDFSAQNPNECRQRLKQLQQEHDTLRKKVNVKVMNMIDRVVTKERSLKQMLATVHRDKNKIEETIQQLDHYKKEALQKTWSKVNRYTFDLFVFDYSDFGNIFNELLPGNTSKLEPPEGQSITEGLEVKVCLGGVWKQSLTELSGGQRSLIALSLILSLLQFKPAPMYILDEIDAALDLSHTQNIGHLFKTRFKGSQFIVVSLKEGMFNNANVLFKARFKDGTSIVERFAQNEKNSTTATSKSKPALAKGIQEKKRAKRSEVESDEENVVMQ